MRISSLNAHKAKHDEQTAAVSARKETVQKPARQLRLTGTASSQAAPKSQHFECYICKREFQRRRLLRRHLCGTHPVEKCRICGVVLPAAEFRLHSCVGERQLACEYCSRIFDSLYALNGHLSAEHTDAEMQSYKCSSCPSRFHLRSMLDAHLAKHKRTRLTRTCTKCAQSFDSRIDLKAHMRIIHLNRKRQPFHLLRNAHLLRYISVLNS